MKFPHKQRRRRQQRHCQTIRNLLAGKYRTITHSHTQNKPLNGFCVAKGTDRTVSTLSPERAAVHTLTHSANDVVGMSCRICLVVLRARFRCAHIMCVLRMSWLNTHGPKRVWEYLISWFAHPATTNNDDDYDRRHRRQRCRLRI